MTVETDVRDASSAGGCAETVTVSLIEAGASVTCARAVWPTLKLRSRCSNGANPDSSTRRTYTLGGTFVSRKPPDGSVTAERCWFVAGSWSSTLAPGTTKPDVSM